MGLNLFPVRVPIGRAVDTAGKTLDVLMTQEFARALSDLLERVGGESGASTVDIEVLALEALIRTPEIPQQDVPAPAPEISVLMQEIQALRRQVQELAQAVTVPASSAQAANAELLTYAVIGSPSNVDWTRPGRIGASRANTGAFTTLRASGQITSTLATGTAPLVIASTTKVANLNADLLDGTDWTAPGTIGGVTPGSASFTTVNASGQITSTVGGGTAPFVVASTTVVGNLNVSALLGNTWVSPGAIGSTTKNTGAFTTLSATSAPQAVPSNGNVLAVNTNGVNAINIQFGGDETTGYSWQRTLQQNVGAVPHRFYLFNTLQMTLATGGLTVVSGFGCNSKAAQTAAASGGNMATTAATNAAPYGFTTAAQADSIAVKLNAIQNALVANGIMS